MLAIALAFGLHCGLSPLGAQDAASQPEVEEEPFTLKSIESSQTPTDEPLESRHGFWSRMNENLRFNLDVVSQVDVTRRRGEPGGLNAAGIDMHKVFSDKHGDIGTLLLQAYLTRYDNAYPVPHDAEDDDDWEIVFHSFHFNLRRWGRGATNFKIGHFYIPYGLQPNTDTHLSVYQLIAHENLGADMDWGGSINGITRFGEYEVALTQGTGHEYTNTGKNYVVAGRVGTPYDRNFTIGISAMHGQIISPHGLARWREGLKQPTRLDRELGRTPGGNKGDDDLVRRTRAGVDFTWILGPFTIKSETSIGRDYNQDVVNALLDATWTSPAERVAVYLQGVYLGQRGARGWDGDFETRLGAAWKVSQFWTLSGQYSQDLRTYGTRPEDAVFTLQVRYRF